jgi:hypothetical protein
LVGDEASSLERLMVESRVVVPNAAGVHGHVRLAVALDGKSVSFHRRQGVRLRSEWKSRGVVQIVDLVEAWLKLSTGDHSVRVLGPVQVRSAR